MPEPLDLMARLAARVPPPWVHLTRCHRVFGIEIETCSRRHGRLRVITSIEVPASAWGTLHRLSGSSGPWWAGTLVRA